MCFELVFSFSQNAFLSCSHQFHAFGDRSSSMKVCTEYFGRLVNLETKANFSYIGTLIDLTLLLPNHQGTITLHNVCARKMDGNDEKLYNSITFRVDEVKLVDILEIPKDLNEASVRIDGLRARSYEKHVMSKKGYQHSNTTILPQPASYGLKDVVYFFGLEECDEEGVQDYLTRYLLSVCLVLLSSYNFEKLPSTYPMFAQWNGLRYETL